MSVKADIKLILLNGTGYNFRGSNSVKLFHLLSEKGSTLRGKNSLPLGANSFLLKQTPFWNRVDELGSQQEVTKFNLVPLSDCVV